jgi:hypothetical protein
MLDKKYANDVCLTNFRRLRIYRINRIFTGLTSRMIKYTDDMDLTGFCRLRIYRINRIFHRINMQDKIKMHADDADFKNLRR